MAADPTPAYKPPTEGLALLTTRLVPPRLAENSLKRERLLNRCSSIDDAFGRLYLVTAPAGYGKSTFLAHLFRLAQETGRKAAWLTLDANDNDEEQFCQYLEAAFSQLGSDNSSLVDRRIESISQPASSLVTISNMISHLASSKGFYALFLDDYHVITNSKIHDALHYLLKYLPENLSIFIGSRKQLPVPLARFTAAGRLVHFDTGDLSLDVDETRALFRDTNHLDVSETELELLHQRTRGWAAVLQLTALSLRTTADRQKFVGAIANESDIAADFLTEEIMAHMPPSQAKFLRQIAVVDRFCPALCLAITGDKQQSESLMELQDSGLLIQNLDHSGQWFRMHPLFRDYLQQELEHDQGIDQKELHHRASIWFEGENLLGEAIQHAISGGQQERAIELLKSHGISLLAQGFLFQVLGLIRRLPEELLYSSQRLLIQLAWVQVLSNQISITRTILDELKPHVDVMDHARRVEVYTIESNLYCIEDKMEEAEKLINQWLPEAPEDPPHIRLSLQVLQLIIGFNRKDFPRVMALSKAILEQDTAPDFAYPQAYSVCTVALVCFSTLSLKNGIEMIRTQYKRLEDHVASQSQVIELVEPVLGGLLYYQGDLSAADRHLSHGTKEALSVCASVDLVIFVARTRTRLMMGQGHFRQALLFLHEIQALAEAHNWLRLQACVMHERVRLFLALGERKKARDCMNQWLQYLPSQSSAPQISLTSVEEWTQTAKVRLMLAGGNEAEATGILKTMIKEFMRCDRKMRAMECWILLAKAYVTSGKLPQAKKALSEALTLDHENSVIQLFRDEGDEVITALMALAGDLKATSDTQQHTLWLRQIAEIVKSDAAKGHEQIKIAQIPVNTACFEELTRRELATLALLVEGCSNKEISERLFISTNTVKTHLQRAYGKLGVSSRTQAVKSLKELGIFV